MTLVNIPCGILEETLARQVLDVCPFLTAYTHVVIQFQFAQITHLFHGKTLLAQVEQAIIVRHGTGTIVYGTVTILF
jgi:hypothetical protein